MRNMNKHCQRSDKLTMQYLLDKGKTIAYVNILAPIRSPRNPQKHSPTRNKPYYSRAIFILEFIKCICANGEGEDPQIYLAVTGYIAGGAPRALTIKLRRGKSFYRQMTSRARIHRSGLHEPTYQWLHGRERLAMHTSGGFSFRDCNLFPVPRAGRRGEATRCKALYRSACIWYICMRGVRASICRETYSD